jgi:tetratricopeptide (TPR) repeat protein
VYLLASGRNGTLYCGVTSDLVQRVWEHREHLASGFTDRYDVTRLVWYEQQGIIYNSGHVNVGVRTGSRWRTVDVARNAIIARHRPVPISDARALAHFYNNRGAELMEAGDLAVARMHMEEAIALDPEYATSWSNYGVINLRTGRLQEAEQAYQRALSLAPEHAPALYNIVGLYRRSGDAQRRAEFQARLEQAQLADPFHQFLLANEYEGRGDYPRAVEHYRRAIRLHGNEHRFYFGLARAYLLMGETRRASATWEATPSPSFRAGTPASACRARAASSSRTAASA